jgi:hypothetical protein
MTTMLYDQMMVEGRLPLPPEEPDHVALGRMLREAIECDVTGKTASFCGNTTKQEIRRVAAMLAKCTGDTRAGAIRKQTEVLRAEIIERMTPRQRWAVGISSPARAERNGQEE